MRGGWCGLLYILIAPTLRKYSRVYRELVDSFLRIILSGIFLVVAKGIGSIEVLVDSFFSWGIAYVSGPCGIFLFLGVSPGLLAARPCWQAVSEKPVFGSCILDFVTVFRAAALPKGGVVLILDSGS